MFLDTYLVLKQAKLENYKIETQQELILNEIDNKQGLREPLMLQSCDPVPYIRNHIWRLIQATHRGTVVVDDVKGHYKTYSEVIGMEELPRKQFQYNTFIFNFVNAIDAYNKIDLVRLQGEVLAGNKLVIFIGGTY